jgi:thiamine pyrophosphokinase
MTVLVFANGELADVNWVRPYLAVATAVIAADGGSRYLHALDHRPDLVIGDFDSLPAGWQEQWTAEGTRFVGHDVRKDETDLELALLYAANRYDAPILVFAALGGRLDQTMANLLLLAHPGLRGKDIRLVEPGQTAWLIDGRSVIQGKVGDTVSLIPLGGDARVAATSGLEWSLHDETLTFALARGVSNRLVAETAVVEVESGRLLCVHLGLNQGDYHVQTNNLTNTDIHFSSRLRRPGSRRASRAPNRHAHDP